MPSVPAAPPDRARGMRRLALLLLVAMAGLFAVAMQLQDLHPAWAFVRAFAEAAMVGGLADWFAVTALFRRPLGLPIPHTAIIPENKDRIAETMAGFLRANFLTPAVVARRLSGFNLAAAGGDFLVQRGASGEGRLGAGTGELLASLLESLDPERARQSAAGRAGAAGGAAGSLATARPDARRRDCRRAAQAAAGWADPLGRHRAGGERGAGARDDPRAAPMRCCAGPGWTNGWPIRCWTGSIACSPKCWSTRPIRCALSVEGGLARLAADLQHDPATRARVERVKAELLANPALAAWWMGVWERLRLAAIAMARDPGTALGGQLGMALAELGSSLQGDARLQRQVNQFARRTLVGVANRYGDAIVSLVSHTVKGWDARTITDRIESAVGRDLQFIRINGTLVGGLVGVAIHAVGLLG